MTITASAHADLAGTDDAAYPNGVAEGTLSPSQTTQQVWERDNIRSGQCGEADHSTTVRGNQEMLVATAEISSAAVLVHLEDGALLILRNGMLTREDISEVAAVLEDATVAGTKRTAALCVYDRRDVSQAAEEHGGP
jgi:hypothetical protein